MRGVFLAACNEALSLARAANLPRAGATGPRAGLSQAAHGAEHGSGGAPWHS